MLCVSLPDHRQAAHSLGLIVNTEGVRLSNPHPTGPPICPLLRAHPLPHPYCRWAPRYSSAYGTRRQGRGGWSAARSSRGLSAAASARPRLRCCYPHPQQMRSRRRRKVCARPASHARTLLQLLALCLYVCVYARACACLCVLGRACLPLVRSEALLARAAEPCSTCCAPGCVYLCA